MCMKLCPLRDPTSNGTHGQKVYLTPNLGF